MNCQNCKYFGRESTSTSLEDILDGSSIIDVCYHNQIHGYNKDVLSYYLNKRDKENATNCKGFAKDD